VLRVRPDPVLAAKETIVQREIARQGYPAPAVRLAGGADAGLGGAFMLMDRAPGASPLAGLDGIAALRQLPALARGLPDLLGQVTAALHALDPTPLQSALIDEGVVAPADAPTFLAFLIEATDRLDRADLSTAARWLATHPPPLGRQVIGHGDLHPFNLLVEGGHWTLLDWSTALVADPAYDLAFTTLLLRHPPLAAPRCSARSSGWPALASHVGSSPPTDVPVASCPNNRFSTGIRACTPSAYSSNEKVGDTTQPGPTAPPIHGRPSPQSPPPFSATPLPPP
jgi:aminoglycoside phosphotransferase (APT) family kinase protein